MYLGIIMVIISIISLPLLIIFKGRKIKSIIIIFFKSELTIFLSLILIFTLMWRIPLCAYPISNNSSQNYSLADVAKVRNYLLSETEKCANTVPRNDNQEIQYDINLNKETLAAFEKLSLEYPLLSGYQPSIKKALCSDILQWMGIAGYTYSFTMEVTYNKYTTNFDYPILYSHELAHHNGYYRENEAEFLGIMAMINSDNEILRYSGFYNAYLWINNAYYNSLFSNYSTDEAFDIYISQPQPSQLICDDEARNIEELEEKYEENVNTVFEENTKEYFEEVSDIGWNTQADILGNDNYDGVVMLLLEYYKGCDN